MEQLHHYDLKTDLYLVWVHLSEKQEKEARVIQLALDYHLEKSLSNHAGVSGKIPWKIKGVSSYLHSFWSSAIVSVLLKWIQGWHEGAC